MLEQEHFKDDRNLSSFSSCDGYLYLISGGQVWAAFKGLKLECKQASYQDSSVERFSVMIGVWGGADSLR